MQVLPLLPGLPVHPDAEKICTSAFATPCIGPTTRATPIAPNAATCLSIRIPLFLPVDTVMASRSHKEIQGKRQSTVGRRKMLIRLAVAITLPSADDIRVTFQLGQRLGLCAAHPVHPCLRPASRRRRRRRSPSADTDAVARAP